MSVFWKILQVILVSSVKFLFAPALGFVTYKLNWIETVLACITGGMLGVIAFTFFSNALFLFWHWLRKNLKHLFRKREIFSEPVADIPGDVEVHYSYVPKDEKPKIFNRRNRRIVKIWSRYGLFGIAAITPVILSIPVGTIVANSLESNQKKIIFYMFISVTFWAVSLTTLFYLFHSNNFSDLFKHFYS